MNKTQQKGGKFKFVSVVSVFLRIKTRIKVVKSLEEITGILKLCKNVQKSRHNLYLHSRKSKVVKYAGQSRI